MNAIALSACLVVASIGAAPAAADEANPFVIELDVGIVYKKKSRGKGIKCPDRHESEVIMHAFFLHKFSQAVCHFFHSGASETKDEESTWWDSILTLKEIEDATDDRMRLAGSWRRQNKRRLAGISLCNVTLRRAEWIVLIGQWDTPIHECQT